MAKPSEVEEVEYTKSTHELYLESLTEEKDPPVYNDSVAPNPFHEDGYIGVSPEYANAANETDEPLAAEEGAQKEAEEAFEAAYGDAEDSEPTPAMKAAVAKVTRDDEPEKPTTQPAAKATPAKKTAEPDRS